MIGVGFDRPWRYHRAWDRSAIPRPFSRCRLIISERLDIPERLSAVGLEQYRLYVEHQLTELSDQAEGWAISNEHMESAISFQPSPQYFSRRRLRLLLRKDDRANPPAIEFTDDSRLQRVG